MPILQAHIQPQPLPVVLGDLTRGGRGTGWRWRDQQAKRKRPFPQTLWKAKRLIQEKNILLHAEQGLGETIHSPVTRRSSQNVGSPWYSRCNARSIGARGLGAWDTLLATGNHCRIDYHCRCSAYRSHSGTSLERFRRDSYVRASAPVEHWQSKLGARTVPARWDRLVRQPQSPERRKPIDPIRDVCDILSLTRD